MSETETSAPLLPILIYPDSTLRKAARPITPADADEVRRLVPSMFATMYKAPGIGLAANQIGSLLRVIVVDVAPKEEPHPLALINPEIIAKSSETATQEEGCLSIPDQYAEVTRPARVKVRYQDMQGARKEIEADGLLAACLQHEIDHLNGVLFVDYLSALKRNMLLRKLAKAMREQQAR
ncbi:MAG: peptide deformylase [Rhodospirillales bacterium]|nr:peptide deformylase [Rhodospirillales bacterium]